MTSLQRIHSGFYLKVNFFLQDGPSLTQFLYPPLSIVPNMSKFEASLGVLQNLSATLGLIESIAALNSRLTLLNRLDGPVTVPVQTALNSQAARITVSGPQMACGSSSERDTLLRDSSGLNSSEDLAPAQGWACGPTR